MRVTGVLALVLAMGLACGSTPSPSEPPAAAPELPTPAKVRGPRPADGERLVRDLYLAYGDRCDAPPIEDRGCLSDDLQRRVVAEREAAAREGMPGKLGFDPIVDAQDCALTHVMVASTGKPPKIEVVAKFDNFGKPARVTWDLLVEGGTWKVDNLRTDKWDLRALLGP